MGTTRGSLKAAELYDKDTGPGSGVSCMFNPYEYTIKKSNQFEPKENANANEPTLEFSKSDAPTLTLKLFFDTYETNENLVEITNNLWKLMKPKAKKANQNKDSPPEVVFEWGSLKFTAVITSMSQKFTLFTKDGTPVRAEVDVSFKQSRDPGDFPHQNPTSGGGSVQEIRRIMRGDRLDLIAARVYDDATKWRLIADYNGITNPLALQPGLELTIPQEE